MAQYWVVVSDRMSHGIVDFEPAMNYRIEPDLGQQSDTEVVIHGTHYTWTAARNQIIELYSQHITAIRRRKEAVFKWRKPV